MWKAKWESCRFFGDPQAHLTRSNVSYFALETTKIESVSVKINSQNCIRKEEYIILVHYLTALRTQ